LQSGQLQLLKLCIEGNWTMRIEDWSNIEHFKPDELTAWGSPNAWGDPLKMNLAFMLLLDRFRDDLGFPFYVHCGYDLEGHAKKSLHKIGGAGDGSCPTLGSPWLLFEQAIKYPFTQIGVYEHWNNPGVHLGLHGHGWAEPKTLWWRDREGEYHYF